MNAEQRLFKENTMPEPNSGCWIWMKSQSGNGYGSAYKDGRNRNASRVSWEVFNGTVPPNLFVCHKCDTKLCVNPDHLFLGTNYENITDMVKKNKCYNRRVSDTSIREIRSLGNIGESTRTISGKFGISEGHVRKIITLRAAKHVN